MNDAWQVAIVTALVNAAVVWGTIRVELKYQRRDINAAHRRLDKIGAPAASID